MVDIDEKGGIQVIVKTLLEAGLLNGGTLTCTGETLAEQVQRLNPPTPDGTVIHAVESPYKPTGGLRVLGGNLSTDYSAVLKLAGVEGGLNTTSLSVRRACSMVSKAYSMRSLIRRRVLVTMTW